ncbi:hypothetical protein ASD72_14920 [Pseudoxanthomonas sp. Root630]|nr:hypothetical protein ASD72_14920 [Pseudoxanthomonas sp. Root630]
MTPARSCRNAGCPSADLAATPGRAAARDLPRRPSFQWARFEHDADDARAFLEERGLPHR